MGNTNRVVIKVGSGALRNNPDAFGHIGQWISQTDIPVILVSSGARVFGRQTGQTEAERYANGWQRVVEAWEKGVRPGRVVAHLVCQRSFGMVISELEASLVAGIVPVVNERAMSSFGNNDALAGRIGLACGASTIALLGSTPGILRDVNNHDSVIPQITVSQIEQYRPYTSGPSSEDGTGGASAKLDVAAQIGACGIRTIVGPWDADLSALLEGTSQIGTHFIPDQTAEKPSFNGGLRQGFARYC